MAVSYKKLFHLLVDTDISNSELQKMAGFSGNIMTRMKREQYISLESVEKICKVLDCKVDDILEFIPKE
ncbi:helix-turn-helix domain-containing protein [Facklamia hominis]|uniref:helix-turn-helix domain-containing protein n=1 Tax=Facklamia hominis TaxID=178214 RepID=UPI00101D0FBE|nr:helix-turn-helix transcriptional regulator [Facklamia hominis]RYC98766.1 XRE family transcriptional regulator [Facklamia hominis]